MHDFREYKENVFSFFIFMLWVPVCILAELHVLPQSMVLRWGCQCQ